MKAGADVEGPAAASRDERLPWADLIRASGAIEGGDDAVSRVFDLVAAEPVQLLSHDCVVSRHHSPHASSPVGGHTLGGGDQVREEERWPTPDRGPSPCDCR